MFLWFGPEPEFGREHDRRVPNVQFGSHCVLMQALSSRSPPDTFEPVRTPSNIRVPLEFSKHVKHLL